MSSHNIYAENLYSIASGRRYDAAYLLLSRRAVMKSSQRTATGHLQLAIRLDCIPVGRLWAAWWFGS